MFNTLLLTCFTTTTTLLSFSLQAQESSAWLPRNLEDEHSEQLQAVASHALTRQGCESIIEAKLSDSTAENAKYIVTCEADIGGSVNLVYWASDVSDDFASVSYAAKSRGAEEEADPQNAIHLANCREAFAKLRQGQTSMLTERSHSVQTRPSGTIATYLVYSDQALSSPLTYTATCLSRENKPLKVEVFSQ